MSGVFDYSPQFTFTAATTDVLTANNHGLQANDIVQVYTTDTLPAPLAVDTNYYVVATGLAATTFRLSLTQGGTQVDITTTGTGVHTFASPNTRPLVDTTNLPQDTLLSGRQESGVTMYKAPPPADKLQKDYTYDTVTGTLEGGGGGESWG